MAQDDRAPLPVRRPPPGRLLDGYFVPHDFADTDFYQHLGGRSAFVSTTRNAELSCSANFQYELRDLRGGIDADATIGSPLHGGHSRR